jgi:hypothetical protein
MQGSGGGGVIPKNTAWLWLGLGIRSQSDSAGSTNPMHNNSYPYSDLPQPPCQTTALFVRSRPQSQPAFIQGKGRNAIFMGSNPSISVGEREPYTASVQMSIPLFQPSATASWPLLPQFALAHPHSSKVFAALNRAFRSVETHPPHTGSTSSGRAGQRQSEAGGKARKRAGHLPGRRCPPDHLPGILA